MIPSCLGVLELMKFQTPSTKLGPRPEGGDSEGEISGFQVSELIELKPEH